MDRRWKFALLGISLLFMSHMLVAGVWRVASVGLGITGFPSGDRSEGQIVYEPSETHIKHNQAGITQV